MSELKTPKKPTKLTQNQKIRLIELVEANFDTLYGSSVEEKAEGWKNIAEQLNEYQSGANKTPFKWEKVHFSKTSFVCLFI